MSSKQLKNECNDRVATNTSSLVEEKINSGNDNNVVNRSSVEAGGTNVTAKSSNRLRGRIENAKQIDKNFDQTGKGTHDLLVDAEEFKALNALNSFLNIPALSLGLVNPVKNNDEDVGK
jgi:hypothetical protein